MKPLISMALLVALFSSVQEAWSFNPPGMRGGAGHGKFCHRNPAGPIGGRGRGWNWNPPGPGRVRIHTGYVNAPGPQGGPGHGQYWQYNPQGPAGGAGAGWTWNPPGPGQAYYPQY